MVDGIISTTNHTYDTNSGLLKRSVTTGPLSSEIDFKYFWEVYDPSRSRNILGPVVFTKSKLNGVYVSASATRFKLWPSAKVSEGVFAPVDQYAWKRSGVVDFTSWNVSGPPSSNWRKLSEITARDADTGFGLESLDVDNLTSCTLLDILKLKPIAQCGNSRLEDIAFNSFEDASLGNFSNPFDGTILTGASKTGSRHLNLGTTGLSKSGLASTVNYQISFWAKRGTAGNGTVVISGVGSFSVDNAEWKLYEYDVTGVTSLNIKRSGTNPVYIDEVRIHPVDADMTSFTYHPFYGLDSQTNQNNQTVYKEYDEWGRVKAVLDDERNITNTFFYNYKN